MEDTSAIKELMLAKPAEGTRRPLAYVIIASFLLGSFSGSAFGVLLAVSLNSKHYPWRGPAEAAAQSSRPVSDEDLRVIESVRKVSPSVVSIMVSKDVSKLYESTGIFPFELPLGLDSGKAVLPKAGQKRQVGGGTGFVISADGLILTNRHVVADAESQYEVMMSDGRRLPAKVVAVDTVLDIGMLKVEARDLPVAPLGASAGLEAGETVIAIGNALSEYSNSVTKGVISGVNRRVLAGDGYGDSEVIEGALQTDAAINPGNSGGPLVDLEGKVIGVNTAVNRAGQSIGFAIPIDSVKSAIESYQEHGRIVRPWLGVHYVMLTPESAEAKGLSAKNGALITADGSDPGAAVIKGSPAERAGLKAGDVLLDIDGQALGQEHPLWSVIAGKSAGDTVVIRLSRGKDEISVRAVLGELPPKP